MGDPKTPGQKEHCPKQMMSLRTTASVGKCENMLKVVANKHVNHTMKARLPRIFNLSPMKHNEHMQWLDEANIQRSGIKALETGMGLVKGGQSTEKTFQLGEAQPH